jgi:hypothetical protein
VITQNKAGLLSHVLQWVSFPSRSDNTTIKEWAAFLSVVIIAVFLWNTVISAIREGATA